MARLCQTPAELLHSRMMISVQTVGLSSSRIPQPGTCRIPTVSPFPLRRRVGLKWSSGFRKGRGHITLAIRQASSFFSSPEAASEDGVPAKETGVHDFTAGTKNVELMDPMSTIDDQLPSLLSMVVDSFPPFKPSEYVQEAEKRLHEYVQRYPSAKSLDSYFRTGILAASYIQSGVISVDRLVAMAKYYGLWGVLDDFFFDNANEFHCEEYGFACDARESPEKIQEYLDHLDAIFSQQVQPGNSATVIETLLWESGRDLLELSNPEWFRNFVASIVEHHLITVINHADIVQGQNLRFQDLESYTMFRATNVGGFSMQLFAEFANDSYIPSALRVNPYFEKLTMATSIHIGFVNDVFSYHKESMIEQNPCNVITVLMECEGKPFVETVHRVIGLVNTYAHTIMDMEVEVLNSTLRNHLENIKAVIVGHFYYEFMENRYRHPDSFFPELRDKASSWKILPHVNP